MLVWNRAVSLSRNLSGMLILSLVIISLVANLSSAPVKDTAPAKSPTAEEKSAALTADVTQGALRIVDQNATVVECPLTHTDVEANISGFIARVKVTQTFQNPTQERIEAVYVFPLPHEAAVDDMTMTIGQRKIVGLIKRRQQAREIYEQALQSGQTAALLEQERPNIFTQSVANIDPGQEVNIEISYVDVLNYDMGTYEFHYPMIVGPRYNPQQSPGQPAVADAAKINPLVLKPNERTGHDISLTVNLDAGVPIQNLKNSNHKVHTVNQGDTRARVRLLQEDSIPNKDFVLRYDVVGNKPEMALLAHTGDYTRDAARIGNGYFLLMIQPKDDERLNKSPPRELVFLVDVSGSMRGQPTDKVREAMDRMLKLCRDQDTVQVVTFASTADKLFDRPVPVNEANIRRALDFTSTLRGSGGTEMLRGVKLAIDEPIDKQRVRIIVMLTDGYIGNEAEIIKHVGENCGDQVRFWAIGIGQSPNMFLIDGVAKQGGGMGKKLSLNDDAESLTTEVMTRIQRAQLAKIKINWGNLQVSETYPVKLPELWAGRPVIVFGRYKDGSGESQITISGSVEGEQVSWPLAISLPTEQKQHDVLAKVWARQKVEDLMHQTYYAGSPAVEEEVTAIALSYRLMSQYTSFVAVDADSASQLEEPARLPRRMMVPVPLPEGTDWTGFFGEGDGVVEDGERVMRLGVDAIDVSGIQLNAPAPFDSRGRNVLLPAGQFAESRNRFHELEQSVRMSEYSRKESFSRVAGTRYAPSAPRPFQLGENASSSFAAPPARAPVILRGLRVSGRGDVNSEGTAFGGGGGFGGRGAARSFFGDAWIQLAEDLTELAGDQQRSAPNVYTAQAIAASAANYPRHAQKALDAAKKQRDQGNWESARASLVRAYLVDTAAANVGASEGGKAAAALNALDELHEQQVQQWVKQNPGLKKKLELVIRDKSVDEAIQAVAKAASLPIQITPGSVEDVKLLIAQDHIRISYLDLRWATVTQALDWICQPARLKWSVAGDAIVISTDRRGDGPSAWIYNVSAIALPSADELKDIKDHNAAVAAMQKHAEQLLSAFRKSLRLDEESAIWFAPGHLLVFGDHQTHTKVAALTQDLANPKFKPTKDLTELHSLTAKRAETADDLLAKRKSVRRRLQVMDVHDSFGGQLLAAAAAGTLDLEALTELQIAWKDPATHDILAGNSAGLALRSLWTVCEAARTLPDERELATLAEMAFEQSRKASDAALQVLNKDSQDSAAYGRVVFASLAAASVGKAGRGYVEQAVPLLTKEDNPFAAIVKTLLGNAPRDQIPSLIKLLDRGVAGEDHIVLTALACRRAGSEAWDAFRASSQQLLGEQPLRGHVVVIVNRLAHARLPIAVARK